MLLICSSSSTSSSSSSSSTQQHHHQKHHLNIIIINNIIINNDITINQNKVFPAKNTEKSALTLQHKPLEIFFPVQNHYKHKQFFCSDQYVNLKFHIYAKKIDQFLVITFLPKVYILILY